ncbi:dCMP deaminase [Mycobacterium phage Mundrea]|uniref:Deoxycytidylate deaminase n=1 Tax=Mycobacterium phage Mundrea TaxID=1897540 RepID=A0A1C9LYI6_9CAUD|nr:dCMP deaminase [Mycobacterium phage Mundrea]AOQ27963.1 deoxycytidylate deaminase [Mycobacterium phage Mundrea]
MRPSWDEYFLVIAEAVATRSDCERSKVGAVVVKDRRVRATGYNGAPTGKPGCGTCPRRLAEAVPGVSDYDSGPTRCVSVHAEANALLYCDREDLIGATLYITRPPCPGCQKLIDAAGVERVVTPESLDEPWRIGFIDIRGKLYIEETDHIDIGNTRYTK